MYTRKTGMLYNQTDTQRKIDAFNDELREQYRQHKSKDSTVTKNDEKSSAVNKNGLLTDSVSSDELLIIGLMLLLLSEKEKDYLVIGLLAALLLLNY